MKNNKRLPNRLSKFKSTEFTKHINESDVNGNLDMYESEMEYHNMILDAIKEARKLSVDVVEIHNNEDTAEYMFLLKDEKSLNKIMKSYSGAEDIYIPDNKKVMDLGYNDNDYIINIHVSKRVTF